MDPFIIALKERGIPEENLHQMAQDKVDLDVVRLMDDDTLSKYIPHFGDRVYARNWTDSSSAASNNEERKRKLIERLRSKMKLPSLHPATAGSQSNPRRAVGKGNKNAERKTRKIELGWMVYQNGNFKQVRRPTGGGTRELIVSKDDTVNKILEDGKQIFFPKGKSSKGRVEDFDFSLCIMGSEEQLDATLTVGRLYDTTYHKLLRLYICSKPKKSNDSAKQAKSPERFETALAPAQQDLSPISSSHSSHRPFTSSPLMTAILPCYHHFNI
ncbi:uncharacterized protein LOC127527660 [Erpetoichthys calabaricus]|uniref:uncharacterized protein LOC114646322 n=1 Tax=Erpetoichthys calabaricus TaxID=27687 RepID=UPI0010A0218F|nr:uncharacterized protein LOC114646322 [Erpetoichthys calabaricus]XP_051783090.1 uncharacterized protein LOC127527660 [Erpetoichthys calabaricus]